MRVVLDGGETIDLGSTEAAPTISITDYSRRVTDDYGVTTVVKRGFARRMSVRLALSASATGALQRRLAGLRATPALWIADDRYASLKVRGFYKDLALDITPPLGFCSLSVEGLAETEPFADPGTDPAPGGRASTLRFIEPAIVTGNMLVSSTIDETDYPEWASGTTYALGARVIKAATHRIYESAAAGNIGNDPAGTGGKWIEIGATNRWAMFDQALGSLSTWGSAVTVVIAPGAAINALALLDVIATSVRVQAAGYDQTRSAVAGAITFLDMPTASGNVTVTITGNGVSVGTLLIGRLRGLGITEASPSAGITDYSRKDVDEFGAVTIVERAWSKRMEVRALIRSDALDVVAGRIAGVRATPALWIGDDALDTLTIYGFFKDFSITVGENVSTLALSVEGLSTAAPVVPFAPGTGSVAWDDITDPAGTKPANNATKGAPGNADTNNRVRFSRFEAGSTGWAKRYDPAALAGQLTTGTYRGKPFLAMRWTANQGGQVVSIGTDNGYRFPVTARERLAIACGCQCYGPVDRVELWIRFFNGAGQDIGGAMAASRSGPQAYDTRIGGFVDAWPDGTISGALEVFGYSSGVGLMDMALTDPLVAHASAEQNVLPPFTAGPNAFDGADSTAGQFVSVFTDKLGRSPASVVSDLDVSLDTLGAETLRSATWRAETDEQVTMPDGRKVRQVLDVVGQTVDGHQDFIADLREVGEDGSLKAVRTLSANGYVSGNVLLNDGTHASEYIIADEWGLIDPADANEPGAQPTKPFYYINGVLYIDHARVRVIDADVITASNIRSEEVTKTESARTGAAIDGSGSAPSTAFVDAITYTLMLKYPAEVVIMMLGSLSYTGAADFGVNLMVDGQSADGGVASSTALPQASFAGGNTFSLGAGNHTIKMQFRGSAGVQLVFGRLIMQSSYNG